MYRQEYQKWLENKDVSTEIKNQLQKMTSDEINHAFSSTLSFGTAGIRGIIGPGTARMNIYTIKRATIAFVEYLQSHYSKNELCTRGVIIAHDNRHYSIEFSQETANIFTSYGIPAYLFTDNELRPTPLLSYSIRKLQALAGVVITASHNPPAYNGFKIYDDNGCQFLPVATDEIADNMNQISLDDVFRPTINNNQSELLRTVPKAVEIDYLSDISALQFYPEAQRDIKIIFSNQHGTSRDWVMKLLQGNNYDVTPVKEQWDFDPNFSGTPSPNPEDAAAFNLAIRDAKLVQADLILVNDPDSDRIGIGVLHNGEYVLLNGNETAPVLLEYLLSHYQQRNIMPKQPIMYNTFVTGNLSDLVAESYGCQVIKTLTGFKWIGSEMAKIPTQNFVFGFEEAYGYVVKDLTRDKDGIAAALVLAEACDFYKKQNQTLVDVLFAIYEKFGYFYCNTVNLILEGAAGQNQIKTILATLRTTPINMLNGLELVKKEDYLKGLHNMPPQDLLKFYFADGSWFAVRGSGTEPKIKFYFVCVDKSLSAATTKMKLMYQELTEKYLKLTEGTN